MTEHAFGGAGDGGVKNGRINPKILIVAGSLLALLFIGVLFILFSPRSDDTTASKSTGDAMALENTAYKEAYEGRYDASFIAFDAAIESAATKEERERLTLAKTNTALNAKRYDAAIDASSALLKIRQNGTYYALLAQAYEGKGDKKKALEQYEKAAVYKSEHANSNASTNTYQAKIRELEGTE